MAVPTAEFNRRRHERFQLVPQYTPVSVRFLDSEHFTQDGHAYNISEGGIQFELDRGIEPGTAVALQVTVPHDQWTECRDLGPGRSIFVFANVVWLDDEEPGPARMAAVFTRYAREGDRERLIRQISGGRLRRAA